MKLVVFLSLLTSVSFADAVYHIEQYPKDSGDCHQVAKDLGAQFQQATSQVVVSALCAQITPKGYNIKITYQPDTKISLVSTFNTSASLDEPGAYKTEAECRGELAAETDHFRSATGLVPVVSYCTNQDHDKDYPWAIRIETFGSPRLRPYRSGVYLFGQVQSYSLSTFSKTIIDNLSAEGIDARTVRLRSSLGYGRLTVCYYGADRISLDDVTVVRVPKRETCLAILSEVEAILRTHKPIPAISFCAAERVGGYYELMSIFPDSRSIDFNFSAEPYTKQEECEADRARLIQYYQLDLKRPVIAGYCSLTEERNWRVMLLESK